MQLSQINWINQNRQQTRYGPQVAVCHSYTSGKERKLFLSLKKAQDLCDLRR